MSATSGKWTSGAFTHKGMKRSQNQDSFLQNDALGVFAVADGMGGHQGGEIASMLAVETIEAFFKKNHTQIETADTATKKIKNAVLEANVVIQTKGDSEPTLKGMGTTTSALLISKDAKNNTLVALGQVGDSRTYYIHEGKIWQISRDHSLVNERLRAGLITREQLKTEKNKNVLTRAVGYDRDLECDSFWMLPKPGDCFVICSDGLHGLISDEKMLQIVQSNKDLSKAASELIDAANKNGGHDNITAVIVKVS